MVKIKKILVANRAEIAVRIISTCKSLGITVVSVYSSSDVLSPHVLMADESVYIGESKSSESYLNITKVIDAALKTNCDAIHPGYGFLSENAEFARRCSLAGLIFIGPNVESIHLMGDKTEARKLVEKAGIPLPPGTTTAISDLKEAAKVAQEIGFPVLIKAAAGGGGKGMRIVHSLEEFDNSVKTAQSEAFNAFGDNRVFIEKYLEEPRHIEVQIMGDQHGNVIHFFDRECSIQRRHQKVIEEAPSPFLDDELRRQITETAVKVAQTCGYYNAGTVEFLADKHRNFYFLEMNTRLQVEHPVTELITGYDLVALQILVAQGEMLPLCQHDIQIKGHSIECRICAEDPFENFLPSTGSIHRYDLPAGPGIRIDSGVTKGTEITIDYDPLMAKLSVVAATRSEAINKMKLALSEFRVSGVETTISFCGFVMSHELFIRGEYDTHFIKDNFSGQIHDINSQQLNDEMAGVSAVLFGNSAIGSGQRAINTDSTLSSTNWWRNRQKT
jgi:acetyl-CoA carboxylase, biotin carboxylase subunit